MERVSDGLGSGVVQAHKLVKCFTKTFLVTNFTMKKTPKNVENVVQKTCYNETNWFLIFFFFFGLQRVDKWNEIRVFT